MDQTNASFEFARTDRPVTVAAPHAWDGIGQALRSAYRDYREPPCELTSILHRLDRVD